MIHSGLVNQRRGGGFEKGYPSQRNNHPRDYTMRPWVSGFDLPIIEKSQYATPAAPKNSSKIGVPVKASAEVAYRDIFGKTASPDVKYYLSQLVKRVARGGGVGGVGTDGGSGPTGMTIGQRPTAPPSQRPPPGQPQPPQGPYLPPQTPVDDVPMLMQESEAGSPVDLGAYSIPDLDTEMAAEVNFESIFQTPEITFGEEQGLNPDGGAGEIVIEANEEEGAPPANHDLQNLLRIDTVPIANVVTNHHNDVSPVSPVKPQIPVFGPVFTSNARKPMDLRINIPLPQEGGPASPEDIRADSPPTPRLIQIPQPAIVSTSVNADPYFHVVTPTTPRLAIENSFSKVGQIMPPPSKLPSPKTGQAAIEGSVKYAEAVNGVGARPQKINAAKMPKEDQDAHKELAEKRKASMAAAVKAKLAKLAKKKSETKTISPEETRFNQAKRTVERIKALEAKGKRLSNNQWKQLTLAEALVKRFGKKAKR